MKNPTRNLIVEYKGRRARTSPKSMWGDLDLKSIAQQVEEDQDLKVPTVPDQVDQTIDIHNVDRTEEKVASHVDSLPVSDLDQSEKIQDSVRSQTVAVRRKKNTAARQRKASAPSVELAAESTDLESLDAENIRLKILLAAKLREENDQLKAMLAQITQP
jgi:hypothetical protein